MVLLALLDWSILDKDVDENGMRAWRWRYTPNIAYERPLQIYYTIGGILNVATFTYGMFVVRRHSPESMNVYRNFLMQIVVLACVSDLIMQVSQPMLLIPMMAGYAMGPIPMDTIAGHATIMAWFGLIMQTNCATLDGFYYRLRSVLGPLCPESFLMRLWFPITVLWHMIGFIFAVLGFLLMWPLEGEEIRKYLYTRTPTMVNYTNRQMIIFDNSLEMTIGATVMATFDIASIALCLIAIFAIFLMLKKYSLQMSVSARLVHLDFTKQLMVQAIVPFLFCLSPQCIMFVDWKVKNDATDNTWGAVAMYLATSHGIVSNVLMVAVHAPYRRHLLGLIFCRSARMPSKRAARYSVEMVTRRTELAA